MILDAKQPEAIQQYLLRRGWICENEPVVAVEKPGEGNMNYTLRVRTGKLNDGHGGRSLIVKQSRGYVEKYPSIAAPANRAMIEGQFYHKTQAIPMLHAHQPDLLDLDTVQAGLQAAAMPYKQNETLKNTITQLGTVYLGETHRGADPTLLHGDYYPGSWLRTADGIKIIDPEFCFSGPAEFDLGVLLAHLHLSEQPAATIEAAQSRYDRPDGFDETLLQQFTGIEIMRRLIGLAQLPLSLSLEKKVALLAIAAELVRV